MSAFELLRQAIHEKKSIEATYGGLKRIGCPHALGYDENGRARVLLYQTDGESASGLAGPGSGENWRWLFVAEMRSVVLSEKPWTTPAGYHPTQHGGITRLTASVPGGHPSRPGKQAASTRPWKRAPKPKRLKIVRKSTGKRRKR